MAVVEWDEIEPSRKGKSGGQGKTGKGDNTRFMRLEANQTYRIRPVMKPVRFWKVYNDMNGHLRSAIVEDPQQSSVIATRPDLRAQKRYAVLVIDRSDKKLKILEGPTSMFEAFRHYQKVTKISPGSSQGGDFTITVNCPNNKKDRDTTYDVEWVETAAFSEEEKAEVKAHYQSDLNLEEIFKAQVDEEVDKRLFGEWPPKTNNQGSSNAPASSGASRPAETVKAAAPATAPVAPKDDEFNF